MKIEIRLKNVLKKHKLYHHGVMQQIARDLKVHRHTIRKLYHNQTANVSLDTLGRVCEWLQKKGVPADELPGALFGACPSELWQAIAMPGKVTVYLGEYQQTQPPAAAWRWISRRDAAVAADFVQELSTHSEIGAALPQVNIMYVPFRWDMQSSNVTKKPLAEDINNTKKIFNLMKTGSSSSTSILIGSQRVNYLVEYFVADLFGCKPFCRPGGRSRVPFYLFYRDGDRAVESCFGGLKNPLGGRSTPVPGIYYCDEEEKWVTCPWRKNKHDAGVVITLYDPGTKAVEVAAFGFSGRATDAVGEQLILDKGHFWPPSIKVKGKQIGIYICRFDFTGSQSIKGTEEVQVKKTDIISLDEKILKKYLH